MFKSTNTTVNDVIGNNDVKQTLEKFINNELVKATGIILIWQNGDHVFIDGSGFSETEAIWALEKTKNDILNKGMKFNG